MRQFATIIHVDLLLLVFISFVLLLLCCNRLQLPSSFVQCHTTTTSISSSNNNHHHHHETTNHQQNQNQQQQQQHLLYQKPYQKYQSRHLIKESSMMIQPKLGSILTNLINTYTSTTDNNNFMAQTRTENNIIDTNTNHNHNNMMIQMIPNYDDDDSSSSSSTSDSSSSNYVLVDVVIKKNEILIEDDTATIATQLHKDIYNTTTTNTNTEIIQITSCYQSICSIYVPIYSLYTLSNLHYIHFIRPSIYTRNNHAITSTETITVTATTEDVVVAKSSSSSVVTTNATTNNMNGWDNTEELRLLYNVTGNGIIIGILSDSYDCLNGASTSIKRGDLPYLPKSIHILSDLNPIECIAYNATDTGRALMMIIYDIAPNVQFVFYTASRGQADFANGIIELAQYGCHIIIDDFLYINEPFYQNGIVSHAINTVITQYNTIYFSSMNHNGTNAWDAMNGIGFVPSGIVNANGDEYHMFAYDYNNNIPIISQTITIPNVNVNITFIFQWSEPYASATSSSMDDNDNNDELMGSQSDLDIYFLINDIVIASGIDTNIGMDPIEIITINPQLSLSSVLNNTYNTNNDEYVYIQMQIVYHNGTTTPKYMKVIALPDINNIQIQFEYGTSGTSTIFGHSNTNIGATVGAATLYGPIINNTLPNNIEIDSSYGGTPILFDQYGKFILQQDGQESYNNSNSNNVTVRGPATPPGTPRTTSPSKSPRLLKGRPLKNRIGATSIAVATVAAIVALLLEGIGRKNSNSNSTTSSSSSIGSQSSLMSLTSSSLFSLSSLSITPNEIYKLLEQTAIDINDQSTTNDIGFDYKTGYGFINAFAAFEKMGILPVTTSTSTTVPKIDNNNSTTSPTKSPTTSNTNTSKCGIFGLSLFCILDGGCGFVQRLFRIGKC